MTKNITNMHISGDLCWHTRRLNQECWSAPSERNKKKNNTKIVTVAKNTKTKSTTKNTNKNKNKNKFKIYSSLPDRLLEPEMGKFLNLSVVLILLVAATLASNTNPERYDRLPRSKDQDYNSSSDICKQCGCEGVKIVCDFRINKTVSF